MCNRVVKEADMPLGILENSKGIYTKSYILIFSLKKVFLKVKTNLNWIIYTIDLFSNNLEPKMLATYILPNY